MQDKKQYSIIVCELSLPHLDLQSLHQRRDPPCCLHLSLRGPGLLGLPQMSGMSSETLLSSVSSRALANPQTKKKCTVIAGCPGSWHPVKIPSFSGGYGSVLLDTLLPFLSHVGLVYTFVLCSGVQRETVSSWTLDVSSRIDPTNLYNYIDLAKVIVSELAL